jgi:hypothetical protein
MGEGEGFFQAFALLSNVYSIVTKGRLTLELWRWTGGGGCSVCVFSDKADLYGAYSACYKVCASHLFAVFSGYGRCMNNEFCGLVPLCHFYLLTHQSRQYLYYLLLLFTAERNCNWSVLCSMSCAERKNNAKKKYMNRT